VISLRKWKKPALWLLAIVIVGQLGVSYLVRTRRVHDYLESHLARAFGRPVEVGNFDFRLLPTPVLDAHNVTVEEDPNFGYEYFLRAEELSGSLRWLGLLGGHFEFGTLSLARPSLILVRNAEGHWNLERWLPPVKGSTPSGQVFGPVQAPETANYLTTIDFDDARINFKSGAEKEPFAFTGVSGSVEQTAPGRWRLHLSAQPWRSGVVLQSAGTLNVRGDVAGTSARLQPAEFSVDWSDVSLADLFRLLFGQDYGVRGTFALNATAKSAPESAGPGNDWTFALRASAGQVHRWDLTEREDNPRVALQSSGRWNPAKDTVTADHVVVEAPHSNLRGSALLEAGARPAFHLDIDSAGVQAADLLAWYRAFQPDVDNRITADQYFTGALQLTGWPLHVEDAAFSSHGGTVTVPGLAEPLRIAAVRGGRVRSRLILEPVRILLDGKSSAVPATQRKPASGAVSGSTQNALDLGLTQDLVSHFGNLSIDGHVDRLQDALQIATAFGHTINHGWEAAGAANAALHWEWKPHIPQPVWNGSLQVVKTELHAAGLNRPLNLHDVTLEWRDGRRSVNIASAEGFGATWNGGLAEAGTAPGNDGIRNWSFNLHADHLDAAELDRWLGPRARPGWLRRLLPTLLGGATPSVPASELVRRVAAEGELQVDEFTVEKLKLKRVRAIGSLDNLKLDLPQAEAELAGGNVTATVHAEFVPRPRYEVVAQLDRINLAQLPLSGRAAERFTGIASGSLHLSTGGVGRDELLAQLTGKGDVRLRNAEFHGWDLPATLTAASPRSGVSRWTEGQGSFRIFDRSVTLDDLRLHSGSEETAVFGTVAFSRAADLTVQSQRSGVQSVARRESFAPQRVVRITGALDSPRVSVERATARVPAD
jgi:AsmA family/AsmA-like C-terminal region